MASLFGSWNRKMGEAAHAVGSPEFPASLQAALRLIAPFEMMNGFRYTPDRRALDLYNECDIVDRSIIVDQYLAGAYVLDPFYDAICKNTVPPLIVMQEIAPDSFRQSEYYRVHYASTTIVDEIGFVLDLTGGHVGVLSISRVGATTMFGRREIEQFEDAANLVCALAASHWRISERTALAPGETPTAHLSHPLLTAREREIVALILKGHSTVSIGAVLSLSPETVKVHRRHTYAKLNISSQGELFRLFLAQQAPQP